MEFRKWLASIALAGAATMLAGCPPGETPEDCTQAGDEDGNGFADCEDAVCAGLPQCAQAEDCDNGADDDGDGDADCDDAQCAADPACLVAEICDNNQDDDLDGLEDCADFDCAGDPACIEADCNDETDNDEDGLVDCDDADCDDDPICDGVEICNNNLDDDADGLIDCDDFDCSTDPVCLVEDCDNNQDDDADGDVDCDDLDCAADPSCQAPVDEICNNNLDDDADGLVDCADADCAADPVCLVEDCDNNVDDDGDGLVDCADANCAADPVCAPQNCGNGTIDAGEQCDGADLGGNDCTTAGNFSGGVLACAANCSFDTAGCEPLVGFTEIEPNNTADTANDFAAIAVNNQVTAQLNPSGDLDFFVVTVPAGQSAALTVESLDGPLGSTCLSNDVDTEFDVFDAAGTVLANDDDGGDGFCSLINLGGLPEGDYFIRVKASDFDPTLTVDYTLEITLTQLICGDGNVQAGEACDDGNAIDGDGCDDVCDVEPGFVCTGNPSVCVFACGNGVLNAGETCDDGNTVDGDGCDALCQLEGVLTEIEPNDDGTPNQNGGNGNDFNADAALNNPIGVFDTAAGDVLIAAALNPAGDEDGFAITNTGSNPVQITAETFGPGGLGTCIGIDTEINFRDAAGTELANDDEGGINSCSLETFVLNPGETTFVHVIDFLDNTQVNLYFLQLRFAELVCGNGIVQTGEACDDGNNDGGDGCDDVCVVEPGFVCTGSPSICEVACGNGVLNAGETCDDGNTADNDGCSSLCQIENIVTEIEPNDDGTPNLNGGNGNDFNADAALNNPVGVFDAANGDVLIAAALNPAGDEDGFAITNTGANPVQITAETFGPDGVGTCVGIDTEINFRNAAGAELANDDEGGINSCSLETFVLNPGETTFVHVIDFLDNTQVNLYFLQLRFAELVCGNGIVQTGEACDDGNNDDGDGCAAVCTIEPGFVCAGSPSVCEFACGNGTINAGETCDDGNAIDGDGCDGVCIVEPGFVCTGTPSVCEIACGNGTVNAGETCDDGNTVDGDGCDALCQLEGVLTEIEPNDDGTPNQNGGNGNDFNADAALNNPIGVFDTAAGDVLIAAALNPAGDEDGFAIANTGANPVQITAETFGPGGLGTCIGIDTEINFRDAAGAELANDDEGGINSCSLETFVLNPGETTFVHVIDFLDNTQVNLYFLQLRFAELVCGNGIVQTGETCDDGNTDDGDGCDAICDIELGFVCVGEPSICEVACGNGTINVGETCDDGNNISGDGCSAACENETLLSEIEPNGNVAEADANGIIISDDVLIGGSITDVTDELDFFRVEITSAPTVVRFELFTVFGDCDATTSTLRLRDAAGTQIVTDNTTGVRSCSAIQFPFETAGVFYIQVEETGTNANIASYILEANFQEGIGAETEPNEDSATANIDLDGLDNVFIAGDHTVNTDSDFYAITVPAGKAIRAEIIEGNRAVETCEALGVDSRLTLFSAAGAQLVDDDDDGRGFCSLIDGTGTIPLDAAAKNNTGADAVFFLQVRASTFSQAGAAGQFVYRLALTVR